MTGGGGVRVRALPGTDVSLPQSADHGEYVALLRRLDEANSPKLFSLPLNVERTVQVSDSERVIASLRAMASLAGTKLGFDRESWSIVLAPLLRAWERLISSNPELRENASFASSRVSSSPVDAFVELEVARGRTAVAEVDRTLSVLTRVLQGSELLTPATFAAGKLLMEGAVPPSWEKHWEGPEEPTSYCKAVVTRMLAVNGMLERARSGALLSRPVRLDGFFHPKTFLNALRQQSARESSVAIDTLVLVTAWDEGSTRSGVVVEGLRLQGAVFDNGRLDEPAADAPPFQNLPPFKLAWLAPGAPGAEGPRGGTGGDPPLSDTLYLTAGREKTIAEVQFPIFDAEESARWVLAGAACFAGAGD
jgi:dynein heavy chain 2